MVATLTQVGSLMAAAVANETALFIMSTLITYTYRFFKSIFLKLLLYKVDFILLINLYIDI